MKITYKMRLATDSSQTAFDNQAILYPDTHEEIKDDAEITTGQKSFVKVDLADGNQKLQGAAFVIKNDQGQYLGTPKWRKPLAEHSTCRFFCRSKSAVYTSF
jgi:hypothetical protein